MSGIYLTQDAFKNSHPTSAWGKIMKAATDTATRDAVYSHVIKAAMAAGVSSPLAALQAMHAASPYSLGLKWKGTPLPLEAERLLESTIVSVALRRRNVVNDFISRGKVRVLPDIGVITDVWHRSTELPDAEVNMNLAGGPREEQMLFDTQGTPIPIIQARFGFESRMMIAAARNGTPLETRHAQDAAEKVAEAEENLMINGKTLLVDGFNLYGLLTHPNRLTDTGADFGTPANILTSFQGAMETLRTNNKFGETVFYVSIVQYGQMLGDHKAESDKTSLQRVLELPGVADVKFNQFVPDGEMVGVNMESSDADLAIAQNITTVPWEEEGGAMQKWRVFSAMAPRIMPDTNGQVGVIHVTSI